MSIKQCPACAASLCCGLRSNYRIIQIGLIQDTEHLLFIQHKLMGKNMKSYLMFSMINLNSMSLVELEKFHLRLEGTG